MVVVVVVLLLVLLLLLLLKGERRGKVRKTPYLNTPQQNIGKMNTHKKTKTHHGRSTGATPYERMKGTKGLWTHLMSKEAISIAKGLQKRCRDKKESQTPVVFAVPVARPRDKENYIKEFKELNRVT